MKIKVVFTKTYYKASTMEIEIPEHIAEDEIHDYLYELDWNTNKLTDKLADADLNSDGSLEIEEYDILENNVE